MAKPKWKQVNYCNGPIVCNERGTGGIETPVKILFACWQAYTEKIRSCIFLHKKSLVEQALASSIPIYFTHLFSLIHIWNWYLKNYLKIFYITLEFFNFST